MRRRDFILLGSAAAVTPRLSRAQQKAMPAIGFLSSGSPEELAAFSAPFRDGLKQAGYTEGTNVLIEFAWARSKYERLPAMAENLVRRNVAVIVAAGGAVAALAAKAATSTIPIVISIGDDPVKFGIVTNLSRPGGNITGVTLFMGELVEKRLELLVELMPSADLALLSNPQNPNAESEAAQTEAAARRIGRTFRVFKATNEAEIEAVFAEIARQPGTAVIVGADPYFFAQRAQIAGSATRHTLPAVYFHRSFAAADGLMSYGATITAESYMAGVYTGRILGGEKPGDLPVLQPTKLELVINLKTAKALGLTVPRTLLARADEIIE